MPLIFIFLLTLACHVTATCQTPGVNAGQPDNRALSKQDTLEMAATGNTERRSNENRLRQIMIDDQLFAAFTYDTSGRILEEKTRYLYTKYFRDENGLVTMSLTCEDPSLVSSNSRIADAGKKRKEWVSPDNTENCRQQRYEYNSKGQLTKQSSYRGYSTFVYDIHDRIIRQNTFLMDNLKMYIEYHYDKRGNLLKMVVYEKNGAGKSQKMTTHEYEYDHRINPYKSFGLNIFPGKYTNENNVIRERYQLHLMANQEQVTRFEYTYDSLGYPVMLNKSQRLIYQAAGVKP
jgi:hypothetical protein